MAKKTVKKTKKAVAQDNNLQAIKKTFKTVNSEVQETANFVANDLMENGQQLRDNAAKAVEGIKLSDSVDKIKTSVDKVNTQIKDAAVVISDNFIKRGKKVTTAATDRAEEAIEKVDLNKGYSRVRKTVKEVNAYALETANEMVDMAKSNSEAWTKLVSKAIDGGLKLGNQQQAIIFDTLETMKKQSIDNTTRLVNALTKKIR
ncbi:MAG: hypothetical protein AAF849_03250 [Bacteroidota bacterium]